MADGERSASVTRSRQAPVVVPTNRVNVALPFSRIAVEEPSKELRELAAIVAELVTSMDAAAAEPDLAQLRTRGEGLGARVR